MQVSVSTGKELVKSFYDQPYDKSYYLGCSLGGLQGIKAAEMFPEDFGGIVAGAPALDFNNLVSWRARFFPIIGAIGSPNFISASTWTSLIHGEILKQCDGIGGVIDGIIEDPNLCNFDLGTLLCADPPRYSPPVIPFAHFPPSTPPSLTFTNHPHYSP